MLKRMRLTNFRSHFDTTIDFTNGLNVIIGENGSGKSSIFLAIGVGLFNSIHNMKELVRYGQLCAMVDIGFDYHGTDYRSVREIGKVSSWRLFRQGMVEAEGQDAVIKKLSEIFGLTEVLDLPTFFNEMVGVGQFCMVAPFAETPSMRKLFFNRLLGTDEYGNTYNDLREGEKYGDDLIRQDDLKLVELRTKLKYYQAGQIELEDIMISLAEYKANLSDLHTSKSYFQAELNRLKIQRQTFLEAKELKGKWLLQQKELDKEYQLQKQLIGMVEQELEEVKKALAILPQLEQEHQLYEIQLQHYENIIAENIQLKTRKSLLEKQFDTIQLSDICPTCGRKVTDRKKLLDGIIHELATITINNNVVKPQAPSNYETTKVIANGLSKTIIKLDARKVELVPIETELLKVDTLVATFQLPIFDEQSFEEVSKQLNQARQDIAVIENKIEANMRRIDKIAQEKDPSAEIETIQKEIENKRKLMQTLKTIREVYKKLGPIMAQRLLQQINEEARVLFNDLMGEHYQVDVMIGTDYEIVATIDSNLVSFANLSGGQQVCLALALRLALLKVLSGMEFMLIDEPFDSLDDLSQESVVKSLSELSMGQLIVITHNDAFDADNVIKFELENGVSKCI